MLRWFKKKDYGTILVVLIFLLFIAAVMQGHVVLDVLFTLGLLGIFGSTIRTIWEATLPRLVALISGATALVSGFLFFIPGISFEAIRIGIIVCCFAYAVFIFIAIFSISRHVYITDRVTTDRIIGSICIYLLIGMFFAFIYAGLGLALPETFRMREAGDTVTIVGLRDFIYFSYCTLTTIGYGDFLPTHPVSRMIACMEGIVGPIYLTIMVARLVGMHITQSKHHPS